MKIISLFRDTWTDENRTWLQNPPSFRDHLRTIVILIWTALGLSIVEYWGNPLFAANALRQTGFTSAAQTVSDFIAINNNAQLHSLIWWAGTIIVVYLLIPVMITRFAFRMPLSEMGLRFRGSLQGWQLYVVMLFVMIPLVYYFSGTESFQSRYPFYKMAANESPWPNFIIWEIVYFVQFIALEFFFRGFITLGTRKSFGFLSIFIMTIPYCMIHFGKPMPETVAAIIAGIVLGTLSMKSRSVLLGVLIHYSVAITMDLMALARH